jgi:malate synthase
MLDDLQVTADDLLQPPVGTITRAGLETNVSVALQYLAAWLAGRGAVPINNLMEDAATAEICRAQLWQWAHRGSTLDTGEVVTTALVASEIERAAARLGPEHREAARLLEQLSTAPEFEEFLTTRAYRELPDAAT